MFREILNHDQSFFYFSIHIIMTSEISNMSLMDSLLLRSYELPSFKKVQGFGPLTTKTSNFIFVLFSESEIRTIQKNSVNKILLDKRNAQVGNALQSSKCQCMELFKRNEFCFCRFFDCREFAKQVTPKTMLTFESSI